MTKCRSLKCLNGTHLKLLAMALMLCDHAWATVASNYAWLTLVGRMALPIFAFQLAEGYAKTSDFKAYLKRMFLFALVSEIPFNLMAGANWYYPFHQNVMFTFCIALVMLRLVDRAWQKGWKRALPATALYALLAYALAVITFADYNGYAILMTLLFFLTREKSWAWPVQLASMIYINIYMIKGMSYIVEVFGAELWIPKQALGVLALIPIWLYNGKRGSSSKAFQYACYAFYPLHILVLSVLALYVL